MFVFVLDVCFGFLLYFYLCVFSFVVSGVRLIVVVCYVSYVVRRVFIRCLISITICSSLVMSIAYYHYYLGFVSWCYVCFRCFNFARLF